MRDHGGNLDWAMAEYGRTGGQGEWVDLSTGINRVPYPVGTLPPAAYTDLPTGASMAALLAVARQSYGMTGGGIAALAGAQAAIQMLPMLLDGPRKARVLSPTYNEHAACLRQAGWQVEEVRHLHDLEGARLAVVVNPNNPDGQCHSPEVLMALRGRVGTLVVDESFADPRPDLSLAGQVGEEDLFVLRSFGKFYGLAGLRLGFALGAEARIARLREMAGPWPVCGAGLAIGTRALADRDWQSTTIARLVQDMGRMDALAAQAGWDLMGGTELFRLYATPDAVRAQSRLARAHIWSRIFPWHPRWIRLGLPGNETEWARLAHALTGKAE
ncbi:threonine-phosphate decarboxylase CobD [Thioclava kandeliae]|uniref:threonine-phosphate decarboxylase n=1 Tax=Thioclava kandeliae TaxID=3070818 RepID=A0ABV1SEU7_9RHOB